MREKLIHILGGYTLGENLNQYRDGLVEGQYIAASYFKKIAEELYGQSPEDWCKDMYNAIEIMYKNGK